MEDNRRVIAVFLLGLCLWVDLSAGCSTPCIWTDASKTCYCYNKGLTQVPSSIDADTEILDLGSNSISSLPENAFDTLVALKELDLSYNEIDVVDSNAFTGLVALTDLDLGVNSISAISKEMFSPLVSLQMLDIQQNVVESFAPGTFETLTGLTHLILASNRLTEITVGMFDGLDNLGILALIDNPFTNIEPRSFANLNKLGGLSMQAAGLKTIDAELFYGLGTKSPITSIYLSANGISSIEPSAFSYMSRLSLVIDNNNITNFGPEIFEPISWNKMTLDLRSNPIKCDTCLCWLTTQIDEGKIVDLSNTNNPENIYDVPENCDSANSTYCKGRDPECNYTGRATSIEMGMLCFIWGLSFYFILLF